MLERKWGRGNGAGEKAALEAALAGPDVCKVGNEVGAQEGVEKKRSYMEEEGVCDVDVGAYEGGQQKGCVSVMERC